MAWKMKLFLWTSSAKGKSGQVRDTVWRGERCFNIICDGSRDQVRSYRGAALEYQTKERKAASQA
jgi:hypothetical protein